MLAFACSTAPPPETGEGGAVLFRGGQILDGTGNPWYRGDVLVVGDRIARVGVIPAAGIPAERYIEAVSVVCTSVIVDTFHNALGLPVPDTLPPEPGPPTGQEPPRVVDAGAWVPLTDVAVEDGVFGLPRSPNIARAMGLVPGAVALFFLAFRAHYALRDVPLDISQAQAEFIASRVSAINECFY